MESEKPEYIIPDYPEDKEKESKGLASGKRGGSFSEKLSDNAPADGVLEFASQVSEGALQAIGGEDEKKELEELKKEIMEEYGLTWEEYAEKEEANTYETYMKNLGLGVEDLEKGRTLDVGAGDRFFASYCLKNGISKDIYSLEPGLEKDNMVDREMRKAVWDRDTEIRINDKTVIASAEKMPFGDETFDLIVSNYAMPGISRIYSPDLSLEDVVAVDLGEIVRVLKPGCEARLFPVVYNKDNINNRQSEIIVEKLKKMSGEDNLDISWDKIIHEDDESRECVVIIRKKA